MPRTHPLIAEYEESELSGRNKNDVPVFRPGDTLRVEVRVVDGANERLQAFTGVCIARKRAALNSSFTLRRVAHGEGVERVFPLFSPRLASISVVRQGRVRRSKLYYLRELSGKAARIKEKKQAHS